MLGYPTGRGGIGKIGEHQNKLVATLARQRVFLANNVAQSLTDRLQQLVAHAMTLRIIDGFEMVKVQKQDADTILLALSAVQCLGQAVKQQGAVRQTGERIVSRQVVGAILSVLALVFTFEQIQGKGDFTSQPGQQFGEIGVEEIPFGCIGAQTADHLIVPA